MHSASGSRVFSPPARSTNIRIRLAAMLFGEYFIWGAWYVTVGTWLGSTLHFSGTEIALVAGSTAIGALVAPLIAGSLADRLFATERLLAVLHLLGAVLLWFASAAHGFMPVYALVLLYACCYMPTLALTNTLAFRQMRDPGVEFAPLRVFGTVGWIVAGLLVGRLALEATAAPLRIAAGASIVMAVYCLTLPHTPPLGTGEAGLRRMFAPEVLALFRDRSFVVFTAASLLICIPLQFYYAFTNLFLHEAGVHNAAGKMTGGQFSELGCMLLIPWFFRRFGVKGMLLSGMAAWALRYVLFAFGNNGSGMSLLWIGILLHGICYDFFFVTGQIYIDRKAPLVVRTAAQGLMTQITYGAGMLIGSYLSGAVVDHYAMSGGVHAWRSIWLVAAGCSATVLALFWATFHDRATETGVATTIAEASADAPATLA
ncbi:nucleoside permease [Acidipila sp. EB88]|uniref:nucleoside permease n=1 Tax=Acidipila sp. EB88 TaxID=2305226 RepID=UPI000F5FBFA8|nr:nucleoside permease [Acidipila sp. EB88]RRA49105.1 MFS transporter [Acidipila sp. EB88]